MRQRNKEKILRIQYKNKIYKEKLICSPCQTNFVTTTDKRSVDNTYTLDEQNNNGNTFINIVKLPIIFQFWLSLKIILKNYSNKNFNLSITYETINAYAQNDIFFYQIQALMTGIRTYRHEDNACHIDICLKRWFLTCEKVKLIPSKASRMVEWSRGTESYLCKPLFTI